MTAELAKRMMDACYTAKRIRDMLPVLPGGVAPSYIHILDVINKKTLKNETVKVSDVSDALGLPRPGITRTVKEMERKGYVAKLPSKNDERIVFLALTKKGKSLHAKFDTAYFKKLAPLMKDVPNADVETMIRTTEKIYKTMSSAKIALD